MLAGSVMALRRVRSVRVVPAATTPLLTAVAPTGSVALMSRPGTLEHGLVDAISHASAEDVV